MKVPALGKVESVLLIGGVALAGYAVYKAYQVGAKAKQSVADTVTSISDEAVRLYHKVIPTTPPPISSLPTSGDYPESGKVRYESTHATPDEIKEYFPVMSPDAVGN